jgi:hypothetical protein
VARGQREIVTDPDAALANLLDSVDGLDESEQRAQLDALLAADAVSPEATLDRSVLAEWARWDARHGILAEPPTVAEAFPRPATG